MPVLYTDKENTSTLTTSITIPKMDLSLLKDLAKKFGWTINNTSQQMSGLEEALNDVKTGNVFHANSAKDLIEQCLK
ncbi:hypothetical protein ST44_02350 [Prevotella pectinovora]|uniref:Uncharacterized protein n=1 Tax=Prevotella pectinovora TaxID=1602169 RepID=A0A0D0I7P1_9BACT|nr:hypothetical protein ST44_02350 [Prevotella pectinovora]